MQLLYIADDPDKGVHLPEPTWTFLMSAAAYQGNVEICKLHGFLCEIVWEEMWRRLDRQQQRDEADYVFLLFLNILELVWHI